MSFTSIVSFCVHECCKCGIPFAVTKYYDGQCRKTGQMFYCPSGHPQSYTENDIDKYRRMYERQMQENARLNDNIENERKSHAATKGQLTKLKKRTAEGVCPCCNRSFSNLRRHMHNQHPEYVTGQHLKVVKS